MPFFWIATAARVFWFVWSNLRLARIFGGHVGLTVHKGRRFKPICDIQLSL
jgi:hypothetical protein